MDPRLFLKLAPEGRQIMTFALSQALEMLQMPQQELAQWLFKEIEKNPLLELDMRPLKKKFEGEFPSPVNLYDHLKKQIRENFSQPKDLMIAEECLEHLDEKGFLSCSVESLSSLFNKSIEPILTVLQTFDPPGVFARNLQESLLLQLKAKGKEKSLAFNLIQTCFEDLLYGRYGAIKKKLKEADISQAIGELASLSLRPIEAFNQEPAAPIYPDLSIQKVEGGWTLELIEEELPKFHIQEQYLDLDIDSAEEKEALCTFKAQAKWLCRSLNRRRKLLKELGRILVCKQASFLDQKGPLVPLKMKEIAEKLNIHESTLSRALSGKYAETPRGILPLRSLILTDPQAENARELLERLIQTEDKQNPLTDDQLAKELSAKGFRVARRTVSKYRSQLKIGSASQRKHITDRQPTTRDRDGGIKGR